jgi:hypothetical protein
MTGIHTAALGRPAAHPAAWRHLGDSAMDVEQRIVREQTRLHVEALRKAVLLQQPVVHLPVASNAIVRPDSGM